MFVSCCLIDTLERLYSVLLVSSSSGTNWLLQERVSLFWWQRMQHVSVCVSHPEVKRVPNKSCLFLYRFALVMRQMTGNCNDLRNSLCLCMCWCVCVCNHPTIFFLLSSCVCCSLRESPVVYVVPGDPLVLPVKKYRSGAEDQRWRRNVSSSSRNRLCKATFQHYNSAYTWRMVTCKRRPSSTLVQCSKFSQGVIVRVWFVESIKSFGWTCTAESYMYVKLTYILILHLLRISRWCCHTL